MSSAANVRSLEAIQRFRAALIRFADEANSALSSLRQDLDRTVEWIDHDRPRYWQQRMRMGADKVDQARSALARCRMRTIAGRHPTCVDEQVALRKAKHEIEVARQKVEVVRRWKIKLHQEADEYRGQIGVFEQRLYQELPRMVALLEGMLGALEAYVSVPKPTSEASARLTSGGSGVDQPEPESTQTSEPQPADEET